MHSAHTELSDPQVTASVLPGMCVTFWCANPAILSVCI